MKKSILLLVICGLLGFACAASPGGKACVKKVFASTVKKKGPLKKTSEPNNWMSMLIGPFESFIYRIL